MRGAEEQGRALPGARPGLQPGVPGDDVEAGPPLPVQDAAEDVGLDPRFAPAVDEALAVAETQLVQCADVDLDGPVQVCFTTAVENLARRVADQQLLDRLAQEGFAGPAYEIFQAELVAYGFPVLMDWMYTGKIFTLCSAKHRGLAAPDRVRHVLRETREDREELAYETLAKGLCLFRDRSLLGGGWRVAGGATVKTFFIGALLLSFPNVFRKWLKDCQHWDRLWSVEESAHPQELLPVWELPPADPADLVVGHLTVLDYLQGIADPHTRAAAALVLADLPRARIGDTLGLSADAVNMRLSRLRRSLPRTSHDRSDQAGRSSE